MAFIRSIDEISKKWADVTPQRAGDYASGIANPRRSWAQATTNAADAYKAGVTASIAQGTFQRGVRKAGDEKWQRKSLSRGVANWGPGVADAEGDYKAGFSPYRDAIENCTLPPRYARRDPRNMARVTAIVKCLIEAKERQITARV